MSEYDHLTVEVDRDSENREREGRARRRPPIGQFRERPSRRVKIQRLDPETLEGFWGDVVSGAVGLTPLSAKSPEQVLSSRREAAVLEGQFVDLPEDVKVCK